MTIQKKHDQTRDSKDKTRRFYVSLYPFSTALLSGLFWVGLTLKMQQFNLLNPSIAIVLLSQTVLIVCWVYRSCANEKQPSTQEQRINSMAMRVDRLIPSANVDNTTSAKKWPKFKAGIKNKYSFLKDSIPNTIGGVAAGIILAALAAGGLFFLGQSQPLASPLSGTFIEIDKEEGRKATLNPKRETIRIESSDGQAPIFGKFGNEQDGFLMGLFYESELCVGNFVIERLSPNRIRIFCHIWNSQEPFDINMISY